MASTLDVPALAKGFNLVVLALCVVCSVAFVIGYHSYFSVLIGVEVSVLAAFQLAIELGQPVSFLDMLRASLPGVLGLNGQLVTSIVLVLFLFGMGTFGIAMACIVVVLLACNAYVITAYGDPAGRRTVGGDSSAEDSQDAFSQPSYAPNNPHADPYGKGIPSTADL